MALSARKDLHSPTGGTRNAPPQTVCWGPCKMLHPVPDSSPTPRRRPIEIFQCRPQPYFPQGKLRLQGIGVLGVGDVFDAPSSPTQKQ